MTGQGWKVNRPFRTAVRTGLALSVLPAIAFVITPMPVWSCIFALAYCLLLALIVMGLVLAGPRLARWWLFSHVFPLSAILGVWLVQLGSAPAAFVQVLERVMPLYLAVLYIWLAASAVIAGVGWVRYIRSYRSEAEAEPLSWRTDLTNTEGASGQ